MTLLSRLGDGSGFEDLASIRRMELADGAWVDVLPGWVGAPDELFDRLVDDVPWHAYERRMYGRTVPVPRLIKNFDEGEAFPDRRLTEAMVLLNQHYRLTEVAARSPLTRAGLNLYRDGNDSVAWHSDTGASPDEDDTVVAIVSLGTPRTLSVRPRGGRSGQRFDLGDGDLLVMGGSFQRTHQHAVGKTSNAVRPRISVQYRPTWGEKPGNRSRFAIATGYPRLHNEDLPPGPVAASELRRWSARDRGRVDNPTAPLRDAARTCSPIRDAHDRLTPLVSTVTRILMDRLWRGRRMPVPSRRRNCDLRKV